MYTDARAAAKQALSDQDQGCIKVPDGMTFFQVKKPGTYNFDIIPFFHNPDLNKYAPKGGTVWWETTYCRHGNVGPEDKMLVCLKKTFGEACYCCEQHALARKSLRPGATDDEKKTVKSMEYKIRQLFCVIDRDERKPELQLFEMSFHLFGKHLLHKIDGAPSRLNYDQFFRLKGGMTLSVKFVEGANWIEAGNIELIPRDKDIPEDILDDVPCLDDLIIRTPYAKMKQIYDGAEDQKHETNGETYSRRSKREEPEEEEEATPRKKREEPEEEPPARKPKKEETEERDNPAARKGIEKGCYVLYTDEDGKKLRCQVVRVSPDGTSLTLEDESGEVHRAIEPKECKLGITVEEPEEAQTKPARKPKKAAEEEAPAKPKAPEPDPDEDEGWSRRKKR